MSTTTTYQDAGHDPLPPLVAEFRTRAPLVGGVGLAVSLVLALVWPWAFFPAYLAVYLFFLGFGLGSLALICIHYLAGGDWGFILRRPFEAATLTLPVMALLFLPLVLGLKHVYPWAAPGAADNEILHLKSGYLNVPFFLLRAVLYFALWSGLAFFFRRSGARQDAADDPNITWRAQAVAAPALVALFLSVTFAMIDFSMSIEPEWYSSIYAVMLFVGFGLNSLALGVLVVSRVAHVRPYNELVKPAGLNDVGNLMLAFTMLWAYMSFSQYLIIWSGNLAEEIPWYLRRSVGGWRYVAASLMLLHFFVPFLYLLVKENKRSPLKLTRVAAWLLVMHFVNDVWLVLPAFAGYQWLKLLCLIPAFLGIGGVWSTAYAWQLAARPLVPRNDPLLAEALSHHHAPAGGGH